MASGRYALGMWGEKVVREVLQAKGWQTHSPPGSRGPADIFAFKEGKKWCVQVKARTLCKGRPLGKEDTKRLLRESKSCNCTAVVAVIAIEAGDLLRTASYVADSKDASIIRDVLGNFVAFVADRNAVIFFYDLRTGESLEP